MKRLISFTFYDNVPLEIGAQFNTNHFGLVTVTKLIPETFSVEVVDGKGGRYSIHGLPENKFKKDAA